MASTPQIPSGNGWVVYAGRRSITREGRKYKVYLPVNLNDLWQELQGRKVKVYLVVDQDG